MAQERSIEVKVGLLILVALGILGGFILVMGGLSFEKTYAVYVDFDNPGGLRQGGPERISGGKVGNRGGLQTGAPVRIAGVNVGKVVEMQFRGGELDPKTWRRPMVRCKLKVQ